MNILYIFAHNGVNHANQGEALAHISTDILRLLVVILTSLMIAWVIARSYKKFGYVVVRIKNRRGDG